jgi:hypothetical protein
MATADDIIKVADTINKFSLPILIALWPLAKIAKRTKTKVDDKIIKFAKGALTIIRTGEWPKD